MDNKKIGKFIMKLRKEKGLTRKELAEYLKIKDNIVEKWENGIEIPDVTLLTPLSKILNVDVKELLNGEYSKIEDSKVKNVPLENNEKRKKIQNGILIGLLFIVLILISFLLFNNYKKYHPNVIIDGNNNYKLVNYNISKKGLDCLTDIIKKSNNMTDKYNISYFETELNEKGMIKSFTLSLIVFEGDNYIGNASYVYENNILNYKSPKETNLPLVETYSTNNNIDYISDLIKKIPLNEQIKNSNLTHYFLRYQPGTIVEKGTPIFDFTSDKKVKALTKNDYINGKGGISDGNDNIVIRLYDGTSITSDEQYLYIFDKIDNSTLANPNYMMKTDYYINNGTLKFTRDYGTNWISTDITKEELEETLKYYNDLSLKPNSWFLSSDDNLPIAYFYGEEPVLKISTDNGLTWKNIELTDSKKMGRPITNRVIGFSSKTDGYVALGTDWSMGSGEMKKLYFTKDAGKTWNEVKPPLNNSNKTLIDMCMYDSNIGVILLNNPNDDRLPLIYATKDGGKNWKEVKLNYKDEITYLVDIDSITKEDNQFIIQLGQSKYGTLKAIFKVNDLCDSWQFVKTTNENIHTVG